MHDIGGRALVLKFALHIVHIGRHVLEKSVIATAQIVEPGFAICSADDAIFWTFAVAGKEKFALAALPG